MGFLRISVIAFSLACGQGARTLPDSSAPDRVSNSAAPTVTVATDSSAVSAGGRVTITVTVTNPGTATLPLNFTSGCQTDYQLLDEADAEIGRSEMMCTAALTQRSLAPKESFSDTYVWVRGLRGVPQPAPGAKVVKIRGLLLATGITAAPSNTVTVTLR